MADGENAGPLDGVESGVLGSWRRFKVRLSEMRCRVSCIDTRRLSFLFFSCVQILQRLCNTTSGEESRDVMKMIMAMTDGFRRQSV